MLSFASVLLVALFAYSVLYEPENIRVEKVEIRDGRVPEGFRGKTFVFMSDLHIRKFGEREERILGIVDELKPDYILLGGDYVVKNETDVRELEFFRKLVENRTVFAVLGNHEHVHSDTEGIVRAMERYGIILLKNGHKRICERSGCIGIVGVDDPYLGYDDLGKAREGLNSSYTILLAHTPDIIDKAAGSFGLILSGHTHCGQLNMPFLRGLWIPSKYGESYACGLFEVNGTVLYVSRGVGHEIPMRFLCPPEITVVRFA